MPDKLFVVEKGKHYSKKWWIPSFTFKRKINFTVKFNSDFYYKVPSRYIKDTNKIFGISDGYHHHRHSVRLGCRKLGDIVEFRIYYYLDGKHYSDLCYAVLASELKKSYNGSIEIKRNQYVFKFANTTTMIMRTSWWFGPRYLLFPYFGDKTKQGTAPPFNIHMRIKWGYKDMVSKVS